MEHSTCKIAIVSGGAGGMGQAVVRRLAGSDYLPLILDQNEEAGQQMVAALEREGKRGRFICLDLSKSTQVQNAFSNIISTYDRIDVLVNLAGGSLYNHSVEDFSLSEWQEVINANLKATFLCCQAVIGIMIRHKKGTIVNTSSNFAITGSASRSAYSASKAAIIAFTKSLALELAPHGIRVNVIAPGLTATQKVLGNYSPEGWAQQEETIPMGRAGETKDVSEAVAFLASEASSYMTGQTLHVNGGQVMP